MGSGGGTFDAADVVSAARLNQKTEFVGTGAQINGLSTTYAGQFAYCTSTGSGFTADHLYQRDTANATWQDITVLNGAALTESAEQNSTPVSDNLDATQGAQRLYAYYTIPSTYKFVIITGIEWKNGATVNGNAIAGVDLVDANPPTIAHTPLVAYTQQVAVSGASSVQRVSVVASQPIRGNTLVGVWFMFSSGTATVKYLNNQASQNYTKAIAYTGVPPNADETAWSATTNRPYLKLYYRGYT